MFNKNRVEIRVTGPNKDQELGIFLPWDANIDDWVSSFKAIMLHQSFTEDQVKDIFFNEDTDTKSDEEPAYQDRKELPV